jgi:hypothetical protein
MLLLFFKNAMWAAWWPYYTMLLAMEKAATQAAANRPKSPPSAPQARPEPPSQTRPQPRPEPQLRGAREEGSMAASNAFMQAEIPPALRELMKVSIDQAKRAFETFVATSEKAWTSIETSSPNGRGSLFALNAKIVEITRLNAEANFALAAKLADAKDVAQAIELQSQHVKQQMEIFVHQLEEMRDLAAQMIQQANPAARTDAGVRSAASGSSSGLSSSSHAPTSSFTPSETGRTY